MKLMKKLTFLYMAVGMFLFFNATAKADEIIDIGTPEQLLSIGKNPEYPLDGDYVLNNDIDMSGASYMPIGTVEEPFTGTFDGAGHAIKNVEIAGLELGNLDESDYKNVTGYGIFGVIKNSSDGDKTIISNLNICNAVIADEKCKDSAAGILAAVVYNGVTVKNVSIIDGDIKIKATKDKNLYGAGSLIGLAWTDNDKIPTLKTNISDIYADCDIEAKDFTDENTVSGVVGCVYNTSIASITRVISFGTLTYGEECGYGIATSKMYDGNGIADEAVRAYYALEDGRADNGIGNGIAKGVLASGRVALSDGWQQASGILPLPKQALAYEDMDERIYPKLIRNQSINNITEDFYVAISSNEEKIEWSSSSKNVVIDSATGFAKVTATDGKAEKVTLTYTCGAYNGEIHVTIGEQKEMCFDKSYVKAGETLKVLYAPDNATYKWEILDKKTNIVKTLGVSKSEYTVTEEDLESFIYVTVNGKTKLSIYVSSLPVVYIDSHTEFSGVRKTSYHDGVIRICGDSDKYAPWDLYEGATEFKGRGHSSSYYEKVGLKLKLDEKTDMYGVSGYENKHWVLVSNVLDGSLMRNSIVDRFYSAMDAASIMDFEDVILIYNGDYKGVYQLSEHVRIADGRVDIFDYSEYAEDVAENIANEMVMGGELSAHFEETYIDELKSIIESDYSYLETGYVTDTMGRKYELKSYGMDVPEATGGYLVCMDRYSTASSSNQATLYTAYKLPFYIDKPDTDDKSQLTSIKETALYDNAVSFNQTLEYALHSDDFFFGNDDTHYKVVSEGSNTGGKWTGTTYAETIYRDDERDGFHYSQMVDMDSLVQNFLVCEFSQNFDSMKNSFYYQKDIGKLAVVAPFWDYDWSMGNWITTRYTNMPTKWQTTLDGANELFYQHVSWNRMLIRDPYFLLKVWEKYKSVRGEIEEIVMVDGFVDNQYDRLKKVSAANDLRWGHLEVFRSFEDSTGDLRKYLDKRVEWLDKQFETFDTLVESLGYYHASDYLKVEAVNRNKDGSVIIEVTVSNEIVANVSFQVNGTYLVTASVDNGRACIDIPSTELCEDSRNIVEVKAMDADMSYIVNEKYSQAGNYNLIHSNYYVFE